MNKSGNKVTFVDLEGEPVLGDLTGNKSGNLVTSVDTQGNYAPVGGGTGGAVKSVNGKVGDVTIDSTDVGAYSIFEVDQMLAEYVTLSGLDFALQSDMAIMVTPQSLTSTPAVLLIEQNTDNIVNFDPIEHSFQPINSLPYKANVQLNLTASSNGSVFKGGYEINGTTVQGEEQSIDSGISIITFTILLPFATASDNYKFLIEEDGAGSITVNNATIYFEKLNIPGQSEMRDIKRSVNGVYSK